MIAGHFGFAAAVKSREPQTPLWALMFATAWLVSPSCLQPDSAAMERGSRFDEQPIAIKPHTPAAVNTSFNIASSQFRFDVVICLMA